MIEAILGELTLRQIVGDSALIVAIVTTLIEITPIKWNPITALLSWLGKKLNSTLIEKMHIQEEKINALEKKIDMNEVDRIRWEIYAFSHECRQCRSHSKDEFEHVIALNEKYHNILESRGMTNGQTTVEYEFILEEYRRCMRNNSFL